MQDTVSVNNRTKEIVQRCRKRMSTYTQAQREALNEVVTAYLGLSAASSRVSQMSPQERLKLAQKGRDPILSVAYQQDNKPENSLKWP